MLFFLHICIIENNIYVYSCLIKMISCIFTINGRFCYPESIKGLLMPKFCETYIHTYKYIMVEKHTKFCSTLNYEKLAL